MPEKFTREAAPQMPSLLVCAARLARASAQRRPAAAGQLPRPFAYAAFPPAPARLAEFRALCGYEAHDPAVLPPTWPYAIATPLHLHLVTAPGFPAPPLGLIHLRETILQTRPLAADATLHLYCRLDAQREHPRGRELDLTTEVRQGPHEPVLWRSTTTALYRAPHLPAPPPRPPLVASPPLEGERWTIPADTGRRYACVSRNFDPIHLHALTSRWFGFPRPIVHGMWSLARCLAALGERALQPPIRVDARFRSPLFLPGEAVFVARAADPATQWFSLQPERGGRPHLEGELTRL
jgi:hypothetical protein